MLEFWMILVCLVLAAILSVKKDWLTLSGALGMVVMGLLIENGFGIYGVLVIFVFFISSNLVSKLYKIKKVPSQSIKHPPRTLKQVLANGGIPVLASVFVSMGGSEFFGIGCFLAAIAEAAADTWASEIGTQKGEKPYHIGLRRRVEPGLSGAVTVAGSLFGLWGAALIGVIGSGLFFGDTWIQFLIGFIIVTLTGWLGQWLDTIFGAFLQARYFCDYCHQLTDHAVHCERETKLVYGFPRVTNNVVNGLSAIMTGLIAGGLFLLL
ncbi:MAG: DUF92 domain-containing protein [Tuberibacillus sp.]